MIEIVLSSGDRAEAETPEGAVLAARTLLDEAAFRGVPRPFLRADFFVDGKLVRGDVRRQEVGA